MLLLEPTRSSLLEPELESPLLLEQELLASVPRRPLALPAF